MDEYTDVLLIKRQHARQNKDWVLSDEIRSELDSRCVFVFDTQEGPEVYYTPKGKTREDIIREEADDKKYNAIFDAWLFTVKSKN